MGRLISRPARLESITPRPPPPPDPRTNSVSCVCGKDFPTSRVLPADTHTDGPLHAFSVREICNTETAIKSRRNYDFQKKCIFDLFCELFETCYHKKQLCCELFLSGGALAKAVMTLAVLTLARKSKLKTIGRRISRPSFKEGPPLQPAPPSRPR